MTDRTTTHKDPSDKDPSDAAMKRVAGALVAEAPPAPPLPFAAASDLDDASITAPPRIITSKKTTWPLAIAAAVALLAGVAIIGPWSSSQQEVSTNNVASQPHDQDTPQDQDTEAATTSDSALQPDAITLRGVFVVVNSLDSETTLPVHDAPGGPERTLVDINPVTGVATPFPLLTSNDGQPLVLRVVEGNEGDDFVRVQAPIRPHGQTVWVPAAQATFEQTDVEIEVDLAGDGTLSVLRGGDLVMTAPIAFGRPDRPTALHETYVELIIGSGQFDADLGTRLLRVASYSEAIPSFRGGLPSQPIHGSDDAKRVGPETSGSIILSNDDVEQLAAIDGVLGAPVTLFDSSDPASTKAQVQSRPWIPATTVAPIDQPQAPLFGYAAGGSAGAVDHDLPDVPPGVAIPGLTNSQAPQLPGTFGTPPPFGDTDIALFFTRLAGGVPGSQTAYWVQADGTVSVQVSPSEPTEGDGIVTFVDAPSIAIDRGLVAEWIALAAETDFAALYERVGSGPCVVSGLDPTCSPNGESFVFRIPWIDVVLDDHQIRFAEEEPFFGKFAEIVAAVAEAEALADE